MPVRLYWFFYSSAHPSSVGDFPLAAYLSNGELSLSADLVLTPKGSVSSEGTGMDLAQAYSAEAARRRALEDEARRTWQALNELRGEVETLRLSQITLLPPPALRLARSLSYTCPEN